MMSIDSNASSASTTSQGFGTLPASSSTAALVFINPYATVCVRSHVPVSLELKNPNYSKWSSFFTSLCGKFGLLGHIDGSAPQPTDPAWVQADHCVHSWLLGSVSDEVLDFTFEAGQSARALWLAISDLFTANKDSKAVYLSHEFHSLT